MLLNNFTTGLACEIKEVIEWGESTWNHSADLLKVASVFQSSTKRQLEAYQVPTTTFPGLDATDNVVHFSPKSRQSCN